MKYAIVTAEKFRHKQHLSVWQEVVHFLKIGKNGDVLSFHIDF
ncbi:MAG: hypothetical protein UZ01_03430 [Candidatus Brocadia sinica]|uniref:Uncharacterized protein n=1 Tax=Candidatus Brocadia sinica JPN1 TaxID=1197129 RepID=A0ABQ0K039_9BACT|nr:MAG: hypothetical protein UZ01_03430 [Candidatus Brocadia sinica]GAN34308.1 hypothetical protein BROSI_A2844 [Candidatus Brocadia sinica JPN1]